jgi:hypothetical protein
MNADVHDPIRSFINRPDGNAFDGLSPTYLYQASFQLSHLFSHFSPMSSVMIIGFFAISEGQRIQSSKIISDNNVLKTNYIVYTTSIQCSLGGSIPAELRVFASPSSTILPDETIVFVVAKAAIPHDADAMLEACCVAEIPGDVEDKHYQDGSPNVPFPHIFVIGQVVNEMDWEDNRKAIEVVATEYVRDQVSQSTLQYAINSSSQCYQQCILTIF